MGWNLIFLCLSPNIYLSITGIIFIPIPPKTWEIWHVAIRHSPTWNLISCVKDPFSINRKSNIRTTKFDTILCHNLSCSELWLINMCPHIVYYHTFTNYNSSHGKFWYKIVPNSVVLSFSLLSSLFTTIYFVL